MGALLQRKQNVVDELDLRKGDINKSADEVSSQSTVSKLQEKRQQTTQRPQQNKKKQTKDEVKPSSDAPAADSGGKQFTTGRLLDLKRKRQSDDEK